MLLLVIWANCLSDIISFDVTGKYWFNDIHCIIEIASPHSIS